MFYLNDNYIKHNKYYDHTWIPDVYNYPDEIYINGFNLNEIIILLMNQKIILNLYGKIT